MPVPDRERLLNDLDVRIARAAGHGEYAQHVPLTLLRDLRATLSGLDGEGRLQALIADFRREVQDKLGVVFNGCNGTKLQRQIHRQQCEDFLVEYFANALGSVPAAPPPQEQRYACLACSEADGVVNAGPHVTHPIGTVCPRSSPPQEQPQEKTKI